MTVTTIKERIAKAEERIAKKLNTIEKKKGWIEKKTAALDKMEERERYWAECDIGWWKEDIERATKEIEEIKKTIENYNKQLDGATEKERILLKEIPESMRRMKTELVTRWDEFDKARRARLNEDYKANVDSVKDSRESFKAFKEWIKKHGHADYEWMSKTDEEIHKDNERDAEALIIDLYYRVKNITGEITDWSGIRAEAGAQGFTVLNGRVEGKQGRCNVESILAGGYNIQRLHVRVLTHEIN